MIIEELIQELQKYPPDAPVYLSKEGCKYRTQRKMHKRPRKSYHHTKRQNELVQKLEDKQITADRILTIIENITRPVNIYIDSNNEEYTEE